MKSPLHLLVVAGVVTAYCASPTTLRPLYQLLANPAAYAQRAESLAQAVMRLDSLTHALRRL